MSDSVSPELTEDQGLDGPDSRFARWRRRAAAWRDWANAHRWQAVGLGGCGFGAVVLLVLVVPSLGNYTASVPNDRLGTALAEFDAGNYPLARDLAEQVRTAKESSPEDLGSAIFVLGAVSAAQADSVWNPVDRQRSYLVAARYLEEARERGFPPDRRPQGLLLLGKCLQESKRYAQSLAPLHEALEAGSSEQTEIRRLLSRAYLGKSPPDAEQARLSNDRYLEDRDLTPEQRARGHLQQARILLALDETEECGRVLQAVPARDLVEAEALVVEGQLALSEGDGALEPSAGDTTPPLTATATENYQRAIQLFRQAQGHDTVHEGASRQSAYLIGVALRRQQDNEAAQEQFARTMRAYSDYPEGLAASLEYAELLAESGNDEEVADAFRRTVRKAGSPDRFYNPWIPADEFQSRIVGGYRQFLNRGRFELAVEMTRELPPIVPQSQSTQLRAEAHQAWADDLLRRAEKATGDDAKTLNFEARRQLRQAGRTCAHLARLHRTDRQYPYDLWNGAQNYLRGQDYGNAARLFRQYLANDSSHQRARALVGLGEALLALGNAEQATESLLECIELHPKDPASYRARLLASAACVEQNDLDRAKQLLHDNLHHESLTPRGLEWRDSLFALGKILYQQGRRQATEALAAVDLTADPEAVKRSFQELDEANSAFEQAVRRLGEFVARYAETSQEVEARYMIANAHWQAAHLPELRLQNETIESTRVKLNKQIKQSLTSAATAFSELQQMLNRRQDERPLSEFDEAVLRNCYFAQGGVLFDLGKLEDDPNLFEEAIEKYSSATNRYQHHPASLEAFVQIASCYRRLGRLPEARGTIEQAKVVLNGMKPDVPFRKTTRYAREDWISLLDWLASI